MEPRCSGAEVTEGTLTGPLLFSGTGGGVQRGEMLDHGGRAPLPRVSPTARLLLVESSSEQNKETLVCTRVVCGSVARSQAVEFMGKPISTSLSRQLPHNDQQQQAGIGSSFKDSPALATGTQQDQPSHPPGAGTLPLRMSSPCPPLPRP